ncbi:MAG TPA: hypothetical protein VM370_08980 [Candidatus Thermoplasmatota archaeon]|nr:hypothetical protein [Candidatus Thermoplasmatota archaeon]
MSAGVLESNSEGWVFEATTSEASRILMQAEFSGPGGIMAIVFSEANVVSSAVFLADDTDSSLSWEVNGEASEETIIEGNSPPIVTAAIIPAAGTFKVVLVAFGEVTNWSYWVPSSAPPVSLVALAQVDAHWLNEKGDLAVGVGAHAEGFGLVAPLSQAATIEVHHALVGWFGLNPVTGQAHVGTITLDTPVGSLNCPCDLRDGSLGPGTYHLTVTGATAETFRSLRTAWVDVDIS